MDYLPFMREPSLVDKVWMTVRYPVDLVTRPFQALLSIPALSFFVIPAFSSYSTTVNFFFFYLTWAVLIQSNDPLKVEVLGTIGIRLIFYLLPSLGFLFFDSATPSLAVSTKQHGDIALPMGEAHGGWKGRWWRVALISIFNLLLGVLIQLATSLLFTRVLHIRTSLNISRSPPFPWSIAKDLLLCLFLREVLTYVFHRFVLHSPRTRLSKWHVEWQHSIAAPFSLVAHYDHPLTYIIHVFLPTFLPALALRLHLLTYNLYLAVVSLEEVFAYSGYNVLPSGFILGGIARRQERHLMGAPDGNFGCFGLVDFLLGTSVGTDLVDDLVDEADKKQVGKKAKGKAKTIKNKAQKHIESDDQEDREEENGEEENEEEEPAPVRRNKSRKGGSSDSTDNAQGKDNAVSSRRKPSGQSRKSKKNSDEGGGTDAKSSSDKPKRKSSVAGRRKTSRASTKKETAE